MIWLFTVISGLVLGLIFGRMFRGFEEAWLQSSSMRMVTGSADASGTGAGGESSAPPPAAFAAAPTPSAASTSGATTSASGGSTPGSASPTRAPKSGVEATNTDVSEEAKIEALATDAMQEDEPESRGRSGTSAAEADAESEQSGAAGSGEGSPSPDSVASAAAGAAGVSSLAASKEAPTGTSGSASAAAERAAPPPSVKLSDEPDDFKRIKGIGVVLEGKLRAMGLTHYRQLAVWNRDDIERMDEQLNFKGRIDRDEWVSQARTLHHEKYGEAL